MNPVSILPPVFALVIWTACVMVFMLITRVRAVRGREIRLSDFKYGESAAVSPQTGLPNKNYANLLQLPLLFYFVCLLLYLTSDITMLMVTLAWTYVGLRVVHSLIHLTYNHVFHRFIPFALSCVVLGTLWVLAGMEVFIKCVSAGAS
jgi:hypothetical protein